MTTLFYMLDYGGGCRDSSLPAGTDLRIWRPATDGLPLAGRRSFRNLAWWTFSRLRLFTKPDFAEVTVWRGDRMLHRLIATPRWYRFPFMARDDLQLGDLWTDADARGQGLARAAIAAAHKLFEGQARRFWYVVDSGNAPSIRLIEACGYSLVGRGWRTAPLGIRAAGRFVLEPPASGVAPPPSGPRPTARQARRSAAH
jgi:GNAT superfamily N-acetyltransferase